MNTTITPTQTILLEKFTKLRAKVFGFNQEIAVTFTRESSREWVERGFAGLASACFNLSESLKDVPGSYDLYSAAKELAALMAKEAPSK